MVERDKEASILQTFTSGTLEPERTEGVWSVIQRYNFIIVPFVQASHFKVS